MYTEQCHSTKQTVSLHHRVGDCLKSFGPCGLVKRGRCSKEGGQQGRWGVEDQRQRENGKYGGAGAAERIHYIICVPSSVFLPIRCLISLTLMQPQLSLLLLNSG